MLFQNETQIIIGCAFEVYNTLGAGYLETVYKKSLAIELRQHFREVEVEKQMRVYYKNNEVGFYVADISVNAKIILEIKVASAITLSHIAQTRNYLKATECLAGLVINFGTNGVDVKRVFV